MQKITAGLVGLGLTALVGSACAQDAYVLGSVGRSNWAYDCGPAGCALGSTAWRVAAGYRFNRAIAVEAFYGDFGRARSSNFSEDGTLGATGGGLQSLIGWHFGDFEFAAKIGLATLKSDFRAAPTSSYASMRAHRSELVAGLMAAYPLAADFSIRVDVDVLTAALDGNAIMYSRGSDVKSFLIGLSYRF
jgi:hypothetical protein